MNKSNQFAGKRSLTSFLSILGLDDEETRLYEVMINQKAVTPLELSRKTGINRTKVYRLLGEMQKKGLVEEIIDEKKKKAKAAGIHQLDLLLREKESQIKFLRIVFPNIAAFIGQSATLSQPDTKVFFYRGQDGLRQMAWKTLQAKDEIMGYTYRKFSELVGEKFDILWHEEMSIRKIRFREIYSDAWYKCFLSREKAENFIHKKSFKIISESRYIPSSILNINHQVDIYNNTFSFYNWYEGEVFGVEIQNEKIATFQKQLFNIVWQMAEK